MIPSSHAIILGIIQGLTEALPISSSAHLIIFPWFFNWRYQGISFDIALHLGTAFAFIIYFWNDWMRIIRAAFTKDKTYKNNLLWCIVIGTIPAALAGLILEKKAETVFRSPLIIMSMLALFGIILWWADAIGKKQKSVEHIGMKDAIMIGLAQILALIPGVSRSGITITAGLLKGFSREAAARFSFLLATPIVFAAAILKLHTLHAADLSFSFWLGIIFSAVSGFIGIHFLLQFVKKSDYKLFVFYRIALAVCIFIIFFIKK